MDNEKKSCSFESILKNITTQKAMTRLNSELIINMLKIEDIWENKIVCTLNGERVHDLNNFIIHKFSIYFSEEYSKVLTAVQEIIMEFLNKKEEE